ncbi:unnamed protein product [marine sediment metagenome]|uniref:DUF4926 domain-containing protein n=1 Tax=marine sediment metagenome TaxID=412755 RepID=X1FWM0_9ZZZZ
MNEKDVRIGMAVRIVDIKTAFGLMVAKKHLKARRMNDVGVVIEMIARHGGEAFAVLHNDKSIAVYSHTEFEPIAKEQKK